MKDVFNHKDGVAAASFKDADAKKGIVTGYFSNFDTVDSDGDIIRKGAFEKTIREYGPKSSKPRIKHLLNHDTYKPLGKLLDLAEDQKGLYYESQVGTHDLGVDFIKMIESGLITEHSVGFRTIRRNQIGDGKYTEGKAEWEIVEVKLYEGSSLTTWGANMWTPIVGMKSEKKAEIAGKRIDLLCKALKSGTFTDETFELLEIELKQFQQLFIDLSKERSTQAANEAPAPDDMKDDESLLIDGLKSINQIFKKS